MMTRAKQAEHIQAAVIGTLAGYEYKYRELRCQTLEASGLHFDALHVWTVGLPSSRVLSVKARVELGTTYGRVRTILRRLEREGVIENTRVFARSWDRWRLKLRRW